MAKSRSKVKGPLISSPTSTIGIPKEPDYSVCCSNRNCRSHWHYRLTTKLKNNQQSKLKSCSSATSSTVNQSKHHYKLSYPDILSKLFQIDDFNENNDEIYSKPIEKSIILEKHNLFVKQISETFNNLPYVFTKNNLNFQMKYRLIPLISDLFSYQVRKMS